MSRSDEREIARRLAEREGFEPPAGLLERIQSEIPPVVSVGREAVQAGRREALPPWHLWLVAASLIAVIGAGFLTLRVREEVPAMAPAGEAVVQKPAAEPARPAPQSRRERRQEAPTSVEAPASVEAAEEAQAGLPAPAAPPPPAAPLREEEAKKLRSLGYLADAPAEGDAETSAERGVAGGVVGGIAQDAAEPAQPVEVPQAMPPMPPMPPALGRAAKPEAASATPSSYTLARHSLLAGRLPAPASVRVEDFVSYFAGGVTQAEGAPSPFAPGERWRLLRFDAGAEAEFNRDVVARHRRLGPGLYEVELRPDASPSAPLANSAKLSPLRVADLASTWKEASPALRLSAVAAELGEILKGSFRAEGGGLNELLRRARELSSDFSGTPRAADVEELATLIERAARLKAGQSTPDR
jgi:hypothetical protein